MCLKFYRLWASKNFPSHLSLSFSLWNFKLIRTSRPLMLKPRGKKNNRGMIPKCYKLTFYFPQNIKAHLTPFRKTVGYKIKFPGKIRSLKGIKTLTTILAEDRVDILVVLTPNSVYYFNCIQTHKNSGMEYTSRRSLVQKRANHASDFLAEKIRCP